MNYLSLFALLTLCHLVLCLPLGTPSASSSNEPLMPLGDLTNYQIVAPNGDGTYTTLTPSQINEYTRNYMRYMNAINNPDNSGQNKPGPQPPMHMPTIVALQVPTPLPKHPDVPMFSTRPMVLPVPTAAPLFTTYAPSELLTMIFT
ncbi:hypothetical protein FBU31_000184 [Coemansia sp. 'formosensis']|nr:hypothetical protein FBU31_000184 [Coemansia sp. 'formosensis']